jgi:flavin-dependent dehydrogenase
MPSKPTNASFDVFIIGAGPAGTAAAISLRQIVPDARVCIADAGKTTSFRVGESVPPPIKPFLDHLGVATAFEKAAHSPSFRTLSAWGNAQLNSNEFFLHVYHTGWRLDRSNFDDMLKMESIYRGATIVPARVYSLTQNRDTWLIDCGNAGKFSARYVIDASGHAAVISRWLKYAPRRLDRLIGCAVFFDCQSQELELLDADATVIEACQQGWWYTTSIPGHRKIAILMTDVDIARRLGIARMSTWLHYLSLTKHIKQRIDVRFPLTQPMVLPAASRYFANIFPSGIVAVGDAISTFDPLSSQGIIKAVWSSLYASYAIADDYLRKDTTGFSKYFTLMRQEFENYSATWQTYYQLEQRWTEAPFWQRRHQNTN